MSDHDPFEDLARNAGAELRREAPREGMDRLRRSRSRRRAATTGGVMALVACVGVGVAVVGARHGGDSAPAASTTDAPGRTVPVTTEASTTTPPTTATSTSTSTTTTPEATTTTAAPGSTAVTGEPGAPTTATTTTSPRPATSGATPDIAVSFVGDGRSPWMPLGWWDGTSWVQPVGGDLPPESPIGEVAAVGRALPDAPLEGLSLGATGPYCVVGSAIGREIDLGRTLSDDDPFNGLRALAVTADWPLQPRPVVAAGLDAPIYQEIGESLVADGPGVDPAAGDVTDVARADLDGDGTEEVIFTFDHITTDPAWGAQGDFSLVIARLPQADGSVQDQVIFEHYNSTGGYEFPDVGRGGLLGIADLNGDAVMEVVLTSYGYESTGATGLEVQGGQLVKVLGNWCGG